MDYVKAIIIKFVMTTAVLWIALGVFFQASFTGLLFLSLIITVAGFLLGDLYILPRLENWAATITDFILVFAAVWLYSTYFAVFTMSAASLAAIVALVIAVGEVFFHNYMDSHILHSDNRTGGRTRDQLSKKEQLQTEMGEEITPVDDEE